MYIALIRELYISKNIRSMSIHRRVKMHILLSYMHIHIKNDCEVSSVHVFHAATPKKTYLHKHFRYILNLGDKTPRTLQALLEKPQYLTSSDFLKIKSQSVGRLR